MSHPLLTKVLGRVFWSTEVEAPNSPVEMVAAMDPVIADRLEAALDACRECGLMSGHIVHSPNGAIHRRPHPHYPTPLRHPYQPLVDLPVDASGTAGEGI